MKGAGLGKDSLREHATARSVCKVAMVKLDCMGTVVRIRNNSVMHGVKAATGKNQICVARTDATHITLNVRIHRCAIAKVDIPDSHVS